ncbi:PREDICTED: transmembrane protein 252 [Condylura cristata]|uniref:transmembrane protein 252 n=1 Tax=Condylura cristata TaxID=143302 RepID=UPI000334310B|nr:PREDICTED: transmembrane protein 252 [Condylura cristata]
MQNRAGLVLCALVLLTGFLIICLGAFFISSGSIFNCWEKLSLAYLLLPLGFVILLSGIFWSTYRLACESKGMFTHILRQHRVQGVALPLATVDRPDFYPPAYEESLPIEKQTYPTGTVTADVPPPLYTEMGLEFKDEHDARPEAPPSYEESVAARVAAAMAQQDAERQGHEC